MSEHLTDHELIRLRSGECSPEQILSAMRHLEQCQTCSVIARADVDLEREARHLRRTVAPADVLRDHPDTETTLIAFVDGRLPDEEREALEEHLAACGICAADVADLKTLRDDLERPRTRPLRWIAVAASVAMAAALSVWLARPPEEVRRPDQRVSIASPPATTPAVAPRARPEWDRLVATALARGEVDISPEAAKLRGTRDSFRGTVSLTDASKMRPAGQVAEHARPQFSWPPAGSDSRYVVVVVSDDREVARSPEIKAPEWTPPSDLPADRVLTWQVTVLRAGRTTNVLPAPPDPPARFRILSESERREIEEARHLHPEDHLLLGLLGARLGLLESAETELTRHAASHPDDPNARQLLLSLQRARA